MKTGLEEFSKERIVFCKTVDDEKRFQRLQVLTTAAVFQQRNKIQ